LLPGHTLIHPAVSHMHSHSPCITTLCCACAIDWVLHKTSCIRHDCSNTVDCTVVHILPAYHGNAATDEFKVLLTHEHNYMLGAHTLMGFMQRSRIDRRFSGENSDIMDSAPSTLVECVAVWQAEALEAFNVQACEETGHSTVA
jgi:hypothetical protein